MLLQEMVRTSSRVAETSSRLAKVETIAGLLQQAGPDEIGLAIAYLSGRVRQPKLGVGWAALKGARSEPAAEPGLTVGDVDGALESLASTTGKGSAAARGARLRSLFERATAEEQAFLVRLITGELRQGALEGIMV